MLAVTGCCLKPLPAFLHRRGFRLALVAFLLPLRVAAHGALLALPAADGRLELGVGDRRLLDEDGSLLPPGRQFFAKASYGL